MYADNDLPTENVVFLTILHILSVMLTKFQNYFVVGTMKPGAVLTLLLVLACSGIVMASDATNDSGMYYP